MTDSARDKINTPLLRYRIRTEAINVVHFQYFTVSLMVDILIYHVCDVAVRVVLHVYRRLLLLLVAIPFAFPFFFVRLDPLTRTTAIVYTSVSANIISVATAVCF